MWGEWVRTCVLGNSIDRYLNLWMRSLYFPIAYSKLWNQIRALYVVTFCFDPWTAWGLRVLIYELLWMIKEKDIHVDIYTIVCVNFKCSNAEDQERWSWRPRVSTESGAECSAARSRSHVTRAGPNSDLLSFFGCSSKEWQEASPGVNGFCCFHSVIQEIQYFLYYIVVTEADWCCSEISSTVVDGGSLAVRTR